MVIGRRFLAYSLSFLFFFVAAPSYAELASLTLGKVQIRPIPEQDFKRISEYFDGKENTGGRLIFRTDPDARAGRYFVFRLIWKGKAPQLKGYELLLEIVTQENPVPQQYHFSFPEERLQSHEVLIGLTGSAATEKPLVAWKLSLIGPDHDILASQQSFLWEIPHS